MQQSTDLTTSTTTNVTTNVTISQPEPVPSSRSHNPKSFVSWKVISKYVGIFLSTYCDVKGWSKVIKYKKVPTTEGQEGSNKPV